MVFLAAGFFDGKAFGFEFYHELFDMVALNFDHTVLDCSAGSAALFQLFSKLFEGFIP